MEVILFHECAWHLNSTERSEFSADAMALHVFGRVGYPARLAYSSRYSERFDMVEENCECPFATFSANVLTKARWLKTWIHARPLASASTRVARQRQPSQLTR